MKPHIRRDPRKAFSLVELLFAIAIISTLAAVAILNLSDVGGAAEAVKSRRNAQSICELYQSARSAGAVFTSTTKEGILDELITGKHGAGALATSLFQLALAGEEQGAALALCVYDQASDLMRMQVRTDL